MDAILMLRDGTVFRGESFGARGEATGEVVFNTSMTGYQEILSDPSYKGQIVTMTYPMIGNYGVNAEDFESRGLFLSGMVVREFSRNYSNWRGVGSLDNLMRRHNVVGISDIDTRALTRKLRDRGTMNGIISTVYTDENSLLAKVRAAPDIVGHDYVADVTCERAWNWSEGSSSDKILLGKPKYHVLVLDCGVKYNILRSLAERGCKLTVAPAGIRPPEIKELKPDGLVLSNGPGDPAALPQIVSTTRELLEAVPILGICLGHQILALAFGGRTYKLPFGHHGANHPVKNHQTSRIEITSQNHGFAVDRESLPADVEVTHTSLFDGTVEGMRHRKLPIAGIQYHPEAAPGPHDSSYLFNQFIASIEKWKKSV